MEKKKKKASQETVIAIGLYQIYIFYTYAQKTLCHELMFTFPQYCPH